MTKQVYQYNPTYVFIELGINELYVESNEDFVVRLSKIIDGIKENTKLNEATPLFMRIDKEKCLEEIFSN